MKSRSRIQLPILLSVALAAGQAGANSFRCESDFAHLPSSARYPRDPGQELIHQAIVFAKKIHQGEIRKFDRLPYAVHPVRVTKVLKRFVADPELLAASYLHDTIETKKTTPEEIARLFGDRVARIVLELSTDKVRAAELGKAQYLLNKMNQMSDDALLIKLADRLDNVSDFHRATRSFVKSYTEETNFILAGLTRDLTPAQRRLIEEIQAKLRRP